MLNFYVIAIMKHDRDNWNAGAPTLLAIAEGEDAAKRWITEEVKKPNYAQGEHVQWWIDFGGFELRRMTIQT